MSKAVIVPSFTVAGQTFKSKKEANAYGVIVDQVDTYATNAGLTEAQANVILDAYRAGALSLPKVERKPKAAKE